jgi:hypothetical protein
LEEGEDVLQQRREVDHSSPSSADIKKSGATLLYASPVSGA